MRPILLFPFLAGLAAVSAFAQSLAPTPVATPPKVRPPWELEWAYLSKYREADAKLGSPGMFEKRVVFLGDSITEGWGDKDAAFFARTAYVNRGISGQTTSQMLVRFRQDVIGLRPAVVVILAGTNDIAENGGIITLEAIEDNLHSMVDLARINKIRVVLASVLPAVRYPWRPGIEPAAEIFALNQWIEGFCEKNNLVYVDYYSAMVDANRALRPGLSGDGVHPTAEGYAIMEPLVEAAVRTALK